MRRPTLLLSTMSVLLITLLMSLIIVPGTYSQGPDPTPELKGETAQDYFDRGLIFSNTVFDTAAALADFSKAIELDPTLTNAYVERGKIYHSVDAFDLSADDFNKTLELNPDSEEGLLGQARYHIAIAQLDDLTQAQANIDRVLELNPDSIDALIAQAEFYAAQELFEDAYDQITVAVNLAPDNLVARGRRLEISERMRSSPDSVLQDLETFLRLAEGNPWYYTWQTFDLYRLNETNRLTEPCNEGMTLFPNDVLLLEFCSGVVNSNDGTPENALGILDRAIEMVPVSPRFHVTRGLLLRNVLRSEEASAEFETALELQPGYVPAIDELVDLYLYSPLSQDCELARDYVQMSHDFYPETEYVESDLRNLDFDFSSRCEEVTETYIGVDNPTFDAGTTVVVPGAVMYPLGDEPGNIQGGPLCTSATEATVLQSVRLDTGEGPVWVEIECDGGTGWVPETLFD